MTVKPLLLADHPALEFLDTTLLVHGEPAELIGDGRALLEWAADAGLVDRALVSKFRRRVSTVDLDAVATEARELRAWASTWLARWSTAPEAGYETEIQKLNGLLRRGNLFRQLVRREDGSLAAVEHPRAESAGELIAIIAAQLADLVIHKDASLVKRCAGTSCTLWFLDRTKAHRRRFCSPTACGNREKVAAFRERQRQSDPTERR